MAEGATPLLGGGEPGAGSGFEVGAGDAGTVVPHTISVSPPGGWVVGERTRMSVALEGPRRLGLVRLLRSTFGGSPSEDQFAQSPVGPTTRETTNTRICATVTPTTVPHGQEGLLLARRDTLVAWNGKWHQLYDVIFAGVGRKVGTVVRSVTPARPSILEAFAQESGGALSPAQWRRS